MTTTHDALADEVIAPAEEAFYGLAGDFVRLVEPETESSPIGLLTNFLVIAGVLFGHEAYCIADGAYHYPAEFVIQVGDSSRSRKGTASKRVMAVASRVEEDFSKKHLVTGLSTGEGLVKAMQDGKVLGEYRFLGTASEFGRLLTCAKRDGSTLSSILRMAWDGEELSVTTKTDPLSVSEYFLSLVGHITPQELLDGLASVDLVNGFANRFLFCKVQRSKFLPEGGADVNTNVIVTRLHAAIEASRNRGRMHRDEAAKENWRDVYQKLAEQPKGLKGSICSRAEAHVLRLSLIYALLDGAGEIRIEHQRAALAVWDYCERSVVDVFADRLGDPHAEKILRAVEGGPKTISELLGAFGNNKSKDWLMAKLCAMVKDGTIVRTLKQGERKNDIEAWDKRR